MKIVKQEAGILVALESRLNELEYPDSWDYGDSKEHDGDWGNLIPNNNNNNKKQAWLDENGD